jgi:hypothetical protein
MRRDHLETSVLTVLSIATGCVAWSEHLLFLPVALAFPILWSRSGNRPTAALVSLGYFLAASRGLPQGVANYFSSDLIPGILLWLAASVSFVLVHSALWTDRAALRPVRYLAAAILMAIPPFGITGWAHPLTAAGVLFPGWGWAGIVAMTAGLAGLVSRWRPAVAIGLAAFWLWSAAMGTGPSLVETWHGVDLELGASLGRDNDLVRQKALLTFVTDAGKAGAQVVVLPESALGYWTPTEQHLWERELAHGAITVLAGAALVDAAGYDNVLVSIGPLSSNIVYRERMPVPGAMWQPWRSSLGQTGGARASFLRNSVIDVAGKKIAPLICYEQLIVWPVLQSFLARPDMIVAVGNGWWAAQSSIVGIQRISSIAWAQLFSVPLVISFNT